MAASSLRLTDRKFSVPVTGPLPELYLVEEASGVTNVTNKAKNRKKEIRI
jgi:hypothetical protein